MDKEQNLLLTKEELDNSPSFLKGMPHEKEAEYRCFACELIRDASIMMGTSPVVSASGQMLCHRFYYYYSFQQCHPFFVAMTCFFVGSKVEEELQPVRRTVKAFYQIYQERTGQELTQLEDTDPIFIRWRSILIDTEKLLLSVLGYHLYGIADDPHRYILFFIKKLGGGSLLAQRAWNILNDSQQLPLCVQYKAHSIACAAIYLASMTLGIPLPSVEWWELFDCTAEEIQEITQQIVSLYQRGRIVWLEDADELKEGQICKFSTLHDSVIVSPMADQINQIVAEKMKQQKESIVEIKPSSDSNQQRDPSVSEYKYNERRNSHHQSYHTKHSHHHYSPSRSRSYSRLHNKSHNRSHNESNSRSHNESHNRSHNESHHHHHSCSRSRSRSYSHHRHHRH